MHLIAWPGPTRVPLRRRCIASASSFFRLSSSRLFWYSFTPAVSKCDHNTLKPKQPWTAGDTARVDHGQKHPIASNSPFKVEYMWNTSCRLLSPLLPHHLFAGDLLIETLEFGALPSICHFILLQYILIPCAFLPTSQVHRRRGMCPIYAAVS